ncbi:MAG: type II toxin-antitoxin system mRNA interferase toxin, RelE/StbE family [Patescibacteria group bacterium]
MIIVFDKKFKKAINKLTTGEQDRFDDQLRIFKIDSHSKLLRDHKLHGTYAGYRSINIGGDLRAIYKLLPPDTAVFVAIDTHTKLYD